MNEQLLSYSIGLLAARDYSVGILQEKLQKKFSTATEKEIAEVTDFLVSKKYLDDARTAENFVRYRREYYPRGRMKIEQEMWKKKYSAQVIATALEENFSIEDEKKCCAFLAQKKIPSIQTREENPQKQKEKLFRFLSSKGFNSSIISEQTALLESKEH